MQNNVELAEICLKNPSVDPNSTTNRSNKAALAIACERKFNKIVSMLLAHSDVDVERIEPPVLILACTSVSEFIVRRKTDSSGRLFTPNTALVDILLSDSRVDPTRINVANNVLHFIITACG